MVLKSILIYKKLLMVLFALGVLGGCKSEQHNKSETTLQVRLDTIVTGLNSDFVWSQAFATAFGKNQNQYLVTMSKQYTEGSDNYGNLFFSLSLDGESWSIPTAVETLANHHKSKRFDSIFSDVYPMWHGRSKKVLCTGKIFFYDREQMPDPEVGRGAGYVTYDPNSLEWSNLETLEFPMTTSNGDTIYRPSAGCSQRLDLENGDILLPIMFEKSWNDGNERNASFVARCKFDERKISVIEVGNSIVMNSGRGIYEPSITKYKDTYYLTMRTDHSAYVAISIDGINYDEPVEWKFTDGRVLGSYNTQQHWVSNSHGLFLVYTRRGAGNDHVFRHRAPLFMAQVDPELLRVIPETEIIIIPERGARLGNFSAYAKDSSTAIIATAERIETDISKDSSELQKVRSLGYNNTLFLSTVSFE